MKNALKTSLAIALFMLSSTYTHAADYAVDYTKSEVTFTGGHAGNPFSGEFGEWTADIKFDPSSLDTSSIKANFILATAKTGNKMYDGTLPQSDWFNIKETPNGTFTSTKIIDTGNGSYNVQGDLTIRNVTNSVTLPFTLSDLSQPTVSAEGALTINRLDYDLGKKSDPSGAWVGTDITIEIDITATKK